MLVDSKGINYQLSSIHIIPEEMYSKEINATTNKLQAPFADLEPLTKAMCQSITTPDTSLHPL